MHMGRAQPAYRVLERGSIELLYRPRVEEQHPDSIDDIQRVLVVLRPANRSRYRLIAIGRKRMQQRFWGFVDLILDDSRDLDAVLGAHVYGTKTRGMRHLPGAREIGCGEYTLAGHDGHTHLQYELERLNDDDVVRDLAVQREGSFIVSVANPDPAAWGLGELPDLQLQLFGEEEVHVSVPAPFPPAMQKRFEGRRYVQLDSTEWLDHPGAELIFIRT